MCINVCVFWIQSCAVNFDERQQRPNSHYKPRIALSTPHEFNLTFCSLCTLSDHSVFILLLSKYKVAVKPNIPTILYKCKHRDSAQNQKRFFYKMKTVERTRERVNEGVRGRTCDGKRNVTIKNKDAEKWNTNLFQSRSIASVSDEHSVRRCTDPRTKTKINKRLNRRRCDSFV